MIARTAAIKMHEPATPMIIEEANPPPPMFSAFAIAEPTIEPMMPIRQFVQKPCLLFIKIPASHQMSAPITIVKIIIITITIPRVQYSI